MCEGENMKRSFIDFNKPIITELFYKSNDSFNPNNFEHNSNVDFKINFDTNVNRHESDPCAWVTLSLIIDDNSLPFTTKISMRTNVKWDEGSEEDLVEQTLKINVPALLLSYIRPILSQITNYSPFNSIEIPFCDFTESVKQGQELVDSAADV